MVVGVEERSSIARKAALTRKSRLLKKIDDFIKEVKIPKMSLDKLYSGAFAEWVDIQEWKHNWDYDWYCHYRSWHECPDELLARITINYLRHREETGYDSLCNEIKGKAFNEEVHNVLKDGINAKILEVYPMLNNHNSNSHD